MAEAGSGSAGSLLVVSAHAGDFVWRAGGAIALAEAQAHHRGPVAALGGERDGAAGAPHEVPRVRADHQQAARRP